MSGPYTVKISNFFDLNGHTSTFEVAGASTSGNVHIRQFVGDHEPFGLHAWRERPRHRDDPRHERDREAVSSREHITVLDGTQVVSRLTRRIPASRLKQLEAGHSVTMTMVWNGRPNRPVIHALKPGSYAIDVTYGDSSGGAAITIGRKRS